MRGKKQQTSSGQNLYSLEDGFSVFDNMKNTPAYFRKGKYEQYARLDNLGGFQIFFTLSSADTRWLENITSFFSAKDIKILYKQDSKDNEKILIEDLDNNLYTIQEYLSTINDSMHDLLRKNVVMATRILKHRFQTFLHQIILNKENPMCVKDYSYKVEFQGRGAAHYHGVLWLDLSQLETKVKIESCFNNQNDFEYQLRSILDTEVEDLLDLKQLIQKDELLDTEKERMGNLMDYFPFAGIKSTFIKLRVQEQLSIYDEQVRINFANTFTSVLTHSSCLGTRVTEIV